MKTRVRPSALYLSLLSLPLFAPATRAQGDILFTVPSAVPNERLGDAMARVGDWDGDGFAEVAVGAPGDRVSGLTGRVLLLSGRDGTVLRTWRGKHGDDEFGATLASLSDIDGDGVDDLAIGSPGFDGASVDQGRVAVVSSMTRTGLYVVKGKAGERFGTSIARCVDVDGDGLDDWVGGGPGDGTQAGVARIHSAIDGRLRMSLTVPTGTNPPLFGTAVAPIPDTDADGWDDLMVSDLGSVHVFSGRLGGELLTILGNPWESFGESLVGLDDLDGDGAGEAAILLVGCGPGCTGSFVRVISTTTGQPLLYLRGSGGLVAERDFTGDGVVDLDSGGLLISTGTRNIVHQLTTWLAERDQVTVRTSLEIDDIDGDGIRERVLGAPTANGANPPAVYFLKGRTLYLDSDRRVITGGGGGGSGSFSIRVGEGRPGAPVLLMIESVNGAPYYGFVGPAVPLNSNGAWGWTAIRAGLIGLQLGLRGFSLDAMGRVQMTLPDLITVR